MTRFPAEFSAQCHFKLRRGIYRSRLRLSLTQTASEGAKSFPRLRFGLVWDCVDLNRGQYNGFRFSRSARLLATQSSGQRRSGSSPSGISFLPTSFLLTHCRSFVTFLPSSNSKER